MLWNGSVWVMFKMQLYDNVFLRLVPPDQCKKFLGPHTTLCLNTIWLGLGCLDSGTRYPAKLSTAEHTRIDALNLRFLLVILIL